MPLIDTYRQLVGVCGDLRVTLLADEDPTDSPSGTWLRIADIAACPEALGAAIDGEAARILATHGRAARSDVVSSRLLHHYLWSAGLLISGPWYLGGVVPLLDPDRLWSDPATGDFALAPGSSTATPDAAAVRASVELFVRPLLDAFQPRLRRGHHALWGMAGDDLVSGIWYLGRKLGDEERAVRLATELLPGGDGRFPSGAAFRTLHGAAGRTHWTRTRTGCCLYYTLPAAEPCLTCPRTTDPERLRRLDGTTR